MATPSFIQILLSMLLPAHTSGWRKANRILDIFSKAPWFARNGAIVLDAVGYFFTKQTIPIHPALRHASHSLRFVAVVDGHQLQVACGAGDKLVALGQRNTKAQSGKSSFPFQRNS
jgi:hypothetical protein